jgi:hypothetical protein
MPAHVLWVAAPSIIRSLVAPPGWSFDARLPLAHAVTVFAVGVLGLLALWVIVRLRDEPAEPAGRPAEPGRPMPAGRVRISP